MSGIIFKSDLLIDFCYPSNKYELEEEISDIETYIKIIESKIKMFGSASPKDIVSKEFEDEPINFISNQLENLLDSYKENLNKMFLLKRYEDFIIDNDTPLPPPFDIITRNDGE